MNFALAAAFSITSSHKTLANILLHRRRRHASLKLPCSAFEKLLLRLSRCDARESLGYRARNTLRGGDKNDFFESGDKSHDPTEGVRFIFGEREREREREHGLVFIFTLRNGGKKGKRFLSRFFFFFPLVGRR